MRVELGRTGIWNWSYGGDCEQVRRVAAELEELGYGAVWFPNRPDSFDLAAELLGATRRIAVATGIVSIWERPATEAARAYHAIAAAHPDRFLLGLGASHPHLVDSGQPGRYSRPVTRMSDYLDELDTAARPVLPAGRVLAALGRRMLALARDRASGAHPYLGTAEHTRRARQVLGPGPLLAPELTVVAEADPARARGIARDFLSFPARFGLSTYLQTPNYAANLLRLGFTPGDLDGGGSDRLIDALVAWGSPEAIRDRIAQHHAAGADHVCIQVATATPEALPLDEWRALATTLRLDPMTATGRRR
jgi:probable F420-dependent oxidoreductase